MPLRGDRCDARSCNRYFPAILCLFDCHSMTTIRITILTPRSQIDSSAGQGDHRFLKNPDMFDAYPR